MAENTLPWIWRRLGGLELWQVIGIGAVTRGVFYLVIVFMDGLLVDHNAEGVMRIIHEGPRGEGRGQGEGYGEGSEWWMSFVQWDAAYYLRISLQGYQDERDYAFSPLYPLLLSTLNHLLGNETLESAVAIALSLNTLCFLLTIPILFLLLSSVPTLSGHQVMTSLLFFIFSPASIFFLTVYTESLFCLLSFSAMLLLHKNQVSLASLCFMFASLTRSNGIFNVVFIIGHHLSTLLSTPSPLSWRQLFRSSLLAFHSSLFAALPFFLHSWYTYASLCASALPADQMLEWDSVCPCTEQLPLGLCEGGVLSMYPSLQGKHWNVGFLTQYHWRQIPNFLLALPVVSLAAHTLCVYVSSLSSSLFLRASVSTPDLLLSLLPHSLHLLALLSVLTLSAHVQISTRVIFSSSPLIYLSLAALSTHFPHTPLGKLFPALPRHGWQLRLLFGWIFTFLLGGLILHPNSFPWT